jgi:hypothetical protein
MVDLTNERVTAVAQTLLARNLRAIFIVCVVPIGIAGYMGAALGFMMLVGDQGLARALGAGLLVLGVAAPFVVLRLVRFGLRWPAKKLLRRARAKQTAAALQALQALGGPSPAAYYAAAMGRHGGAIALAPALGKLALALGDMHSQAPLKTWVISQSELATVVACGSAEEPVWKKQTALTDVRENLRRREAYLASVGLRIQSSNALVPELFIQLDAEEARRWERLLQQFRLGTLQAPAAPTVFPNK